MGDTPADSSAFIIQGINALHDRIGSLRLEMVERLDTSAREQRQSLDRLTDKVDGFMFQQAGLNPTFAVSTRVEEVSKHVHAIAGVVNERAIRQEHIEQGLKEQSENTVARKHLWEGAAALSFFTSISTLSLTRLPDLLALLGRALASH